MRIPTPPIFRPKQRHGRRFWRTGDMLEVLSIYAGVSEKNYPRTWQYRILIHLHRDQNSLCAYSKGYGPDWKCISKIKDPEGNWTGKWKKDYGFAIKQEVLDYAKGGRLPLQALQFAAGVIRRVELRYYVLKRVQKLRQKHAAL